MPVTEFTSGSAMIGAYLSDFVIDVQSICKSNVVRLGYAPVADL